MVHAQPQCDGTGNMYLVGCGYNAYPVGSEYAEFPQMDDKQEERQRRKYRYIIHAEQNALTFRCVNLRNSSRYSNAIILICNRFYSNSCFMWMDPSLIMKDLWYGESFLYRNINISLQDWGLCASGFLVTWLMWNERGKRKERKLPFIAALITGTLLRGWELRNGKYKWITDMTSSFLIKYKLQSMAVIC